MSDDGEIFSPQELGILTKELTLPPRQMEIVRLLLGGLGDKQIASRLGIALPTVRTHMGRLFAKVGAGIEARCYCGCFANPANSVLR